jgi:hypothetical protein
MVSIESKLDAVLKSLSNSVNNPAVTPNTIMSSDGGIFNISDFRSQNDYENNDYSWRNGLDVPLELSEDVMRVNDDLGLNKERQYDLVSSKNASDKQTVRYFIT